MIFKIISNFLGVNFFLTHTVFRKKVRLNARISKIVSCIIFLNTPSPQKRKKKKLIEMYLNINQKTMSYTTGKIFSL